MQICQVAKPNPIFLPPAGSLPSNVPRIHRQVFEYSGKEDPMEALISTEDQARKDQVPTANYDLKVIVSAYFYSKID